jgi:uncharacterized Ntn-hydrolase superfamily protein
MLGIATTTSSICVGARCVWVAPHAGAVATQNVTDPRLGQLGLRLLELGYTAEAVIAQLTKAGAYPAYRQLACVDRDGHSAAWTGEKALATHGHLTAENVAVAGNLLTDRSVLRAMLEAFSNTPDEHLAQRLLAALAAGKKSGGEVGRNERSACLKVYASEPFALVDLRVDWDEADPVATLISLWERYRQEMDTFVLRAIDPPRAAAPNT